MNPSEFAELPKKFKDVTDRFAGSAYVLLVLWAGGLIVFIVDYLRRTGYVHLDLEKALTVFGIVVPLTIAIYRLGSFLDDWLFDPLFDPKTDTNLWWLGKGMRTARARAAIFLESGSKEWKRESKTKIEGLYLRAKKLYGESTPQWEQRIKLPLEISKAARCFVIPLGLVFIYDFWPGFLPRLATSNNVFRVFAFLGEPWAQWSSIALAAGTCLLYVGFRLDHMKKLYALVVSDSEFKYASIASACKYAEFSCDGCLLVIGESEIRRIVRKGCDVEKSFPTVFTEKLKWLSRKQSGYDAKTGASKRSRSE
jgi:hypothetical protein